MAFCLSYSILTTLNFWCNGWCDAQFKYWSVWVFFLYSLSLMEPSALLCIRVPMNDSYFSSFSAYVNLMFPVRSILLRKPVNWSTLSCGIISKMSPTYLFQRVCLKFSSAIGLACCSSHSIYKLTRTGETVDLLLFHSNAHIWSTILMDLMYFSGVLELFSHHISSQIKLFQGRQGFDDLLLLHIWRFCSQDVAMLNE